MVPPLAALHWQSLGDFGPGRWSQSMVMDANDDPWVAAVAGDLINSNSNVERWSGTSWSTVGVVTARFPTFGHRLAITPPIGPVAAGAFPSVAYRRYSSGTSSQITVAEWNGTTWIDLGGPAVTGNVSDPSIAQIQGRKVVAFTLLDSFFRNPRVLVYEWQGGGWRNIGPKPRGKGTTQNASVGYTPAGTVVIACESSTRKGVVLFEVGKGGWREIASLGVNGSSFPRLAVGPNGQIAVTYFSPTPGGGQDTSCATWNGKQWRMMPPIANIAVLCSVAVDSGGAPAVAYEEPSAIPPRVRIAWRDGPTWLRFGPPNPVGGGAAAAPLLALDTGDLPVIAWSAGDPTVFEGPDTTRRMQAARLVPGPGPDPDP
jgi:hypothetical protein